jgi:hypothetical protein
MILTFNQATYGLAKSVSSVGALRICPENKEQKWVSDKITMHLREKRKQVSNLCPSRSV